jgi:hypothetical protein
VQERDNSVKAQVTAPKSYRNLKQVMFTVDGDRFVTRRFGLWVESANYYDEEWLKQRQLREAFNTLRQRTWSSIYVLAPTNVDTAVESTLNRYLAAAREHLRDEYHSKVLDEALRLMKKNGCFSTLDSRGDLLNQAAA